MQTKQLLTITHTFIISCTHNTLDNSGPWFIQDGAHLLYSEGVRNRHFTNKRTNRLGSYKWLGQGSNLTLVPFIYGAKPSETFSTP